MVERLYPGVYVTEIPSQVKPIEGVATSTAQAPPLQATIAHVRLPHDATPAWTEHNDNDPGVTLLQVFAGLSESTLFAARLHPAGRDGALRVSPGMALSVHGRPIEPESTTVAVRVKKP